MAFGKGKKKQKKKNFLEKFFLEVGVWGPIAFLFLLMNIVVFSYYFYMKMEVGKTNELLEQRNQELLMKGGELRKAQNDDGYKRYQASKRILKEAQSTKWKERTEYLIELFDIIREVDGRDQNVQFSSIRVDDEFITMEGRTTSIEQMYREGGVIDKLLALDFIENIDIPSYQLLGQDDDLEGRNVRRATQDDEGPRWDIETGFQFNLKTKIIEYEGK